MPGERRPPREIPESSRFLGLLNVIFGALGLVWNPLVTAVLLWLASQDPHGSVVRASPE